jgi:TetR/AcrR family transcriptional regulator, regulator of cefoperazone and chloramphenicol sensitivity
MSKEKSKATTARKQVAPRPNGHQQRSAETRARLISAAIEVFGEVGYEAASTRELAQRGGANLSAIPYHFGGKRELYLSAAEAIGDAAAELVAPVIAQLEDPSNGSIGSRLEAAVSGFLDVMLDEATPRSRAMFLARCTAEDDEAFERIYDRALAPLQRSLVHAVQVSTDGALDEEAVRLRATSTIAAIISFRLLPGIVLRGMGWKKLHPKEAARIATMVRDLIRNGFLSGWAQSEVGSQLKRRR